MSRRYIRREFIENPEKMLQDDRVSKILAAYSGRLPNFKSKKRVVREVESKKEKALEAGFRFSELKEIGGFKSPTQCSEYIKQLVRIGMLVKEGEGRSKKYKLNPDYYRLAKKAYDIFSLHDYPPSQILNTGLLDETSWQDIALYGVDQEIISNYPDKIFSDAINQIIKDIGNLYQELLWTYSYMLVKNYRDRVFDKAHEIVDNFDGTPFERELRWQVARYFAFFVAYLYICYEIIIATSPSLRNKKLPPYYQPPPYPPTSDLLEEAIILRNHYSVTPYTEDELMDLKATGELIDKFVKEKIPFLRFLDPDLKVPILLFKDEVEEIVTAFEILYKELSSEVRENIRPILIVAGESDLSKDFTHKAFLDFYYPKEKIRNFRVVEKMMQNPVLKKTPIKIPFRDKNRFKKFEERIKKQPEEDTRLNLELVQKRNKRERI